MKRPPPIDSSWLPYIGEEFEKEYMKELSSFLKEEKKAGKTIYPKGSHIFETLNKTSFENIKVVILGQDPYHGPGQAHGLSFSVNRGVRIPPSLQNIYKELRNDLGLTPPTHGHLEHWAHQGVLLLNNVLTVEEGKPAGHHGRGWEKFTDKVIEVLNQEKKNLVFILWGSPAQKKASFVDSKRHFVITSVHPSPLSAHRGFLGSKPFSKTNAYLASKGVEVIDWSLPD
jgi:uracil-DNA glycosylase